MINIFKFFQKETEKAMNPILKLALGEVVKWLENHPEEVTKLVDEGFKAILNWIEQNKAK